MKQFILIISCMLLSNNNLIRCSVALEDQNLPTQKISNPHGIATWLKAFTPSNDKTKELNRQLLCYNLIALLEKSRMNDNLKKTFGKKIKAEATMINFKLTIMPPLNPKSLINPLWEIAINQAEAERKSTLESFNLQEFNNEFQRLSYLIHLLNAEQFECPTHFEE